MLRQKPKDPEGAPSPRDNYLLQDLARLGGKGQEGTGEALPLLLCQPAQALTPRRAFPRELKARK